MVFYRFPRLQVLTAAAPRMGRVAELSLFPLRAVLSRTMSVATKHTGHDRFIASCGRSHLRPVSALHRASHIPHDTAGARRSIRVLITRHTGVSRYFPCPIKHRVQILTNLPCFIAYFYADCQGTRRAHVINWTPYWVGWPARTTPLKSASSL